MMRTGTLGAALAPLVGVVGVAGVLGVAGLALHAQPAPQSSSSASVERPTFRTQVQYVEVDVVVTDSNGHVVSGLKKEDFQVREDGKSQSIVAFTTVNVPTERVDVPLFASHPIPPDSRSNERPFEGRIYVLLLDDLHVDASRTQLARNQARNFIEHNFASNDLMAVLTVGGGEQSTQEFTNDKQLLLAAVDHFMGAKVESASNARNEQYYRQLAVENRTTLNRDDALIDPHAPTRLFNARASLRTIRDVADWFGGVRGRRKSVLYVSEGLDIDVSHVMPVGAAGSSTQIQADDQGGALVVEDLLEAIGAAQRSNVSLYAIDPRGLTNMAEDTITVQSFARTNEMNIASGQPKNTAAAQVGPSTMRQELLRSHDDLKTLAEETGGLATVNTNNFDKAFDRIVQDSSSYYVLAYYPPSEKRDGKFHRIDVQVKKPGLEVRARPGYSAARGPMPAPEYPNTRKMSPELRDSLSSPLPISGLTMHVFAAPFKGDAPGQTSILLGVDAHGGNLNLEDKNSFELSYMALDPTRKMRAGNSDRLELKQLKPETRSRAKETGLRILNRIDLTPGHYQLRVASHDSIGGAVGAVSWDIDVPDFTRDPLAMSGIALASVTTSSWPTGKADEQMRKALPAQPTALREFPPDDELALFAEVYDNRPLEPHRVDIVATVLSYEGRAFFKTQEERSSLEIAGGGSDKRSAYPYMARIPLKDIPPGNYVLNVRAKSTPGGAQTERQIQFTIQNAAGARTPASNAGLRTIDKGDMSFADTSRQVTARTPAEWAAIWRQHAANRPQPQLDFDREMVAGVFLGSRPTAGSSVEIVGTRADQSALVVQYRERRPAAGDVTAQVITSPYHIVALPARPGAVRFERVD